METCVRNYYYEEALELRKKSCDTNGKEQVSSVPITQVKNLLLITRPMGRISCSLLLRMYRSHPI